MWAGLCAQVLKSDNKLLLHLMSPKAQRPAPGGGRHLQNVKCDLLPTEKCPYVSVRFGSQMGLHSKPIKPPAAQLAKLNSEITRDMDDEQ